MEQKQLNEEMSARTRLLLGDAAFSVLQKSHVTVVGLGGVGGHCAEALARAGVGALHLIDFDTVAASNLNRQLVATKRTLGMQKTEAMRERLLDVSDCVVTVSDARVTGETAEALVPAETSFLVDAIDSLPGKVALAELALRRATPIVSCMGAGNRFDPAQFCVIDLYETSDCPLARKLRHELRKRGVAALPVVCSRERAHTSPGQTAIGSLAPVTGAAGLCAAGYVIGRLCGVTAQTTDRRA